MSDCIENKFCPQCGTYLLRNPNGDTYCPNCNITVDLKPKIDLNKVKENPLDIQKINRILGKISEYSREEKIFNIDKGCMEYSERPNQNKVKHQFLLLLERFGLGLTKYYEAYQKRETIDYSKTTGYGYDVLSTIKEPREHRYIEVKTRLGNKPSISFSSNEQSFLVKDRSSEKWMYIALIDRGPLLVEKYGDCFEFFRIPCSSLDDSYFEQPNPKCFILRYDSWRPVARRCRVVLPIGLIQVLQKIRENYVKLFPDKARKVIGYQNKIQTPNL